MSLFGNLRRSDNGGIAREARRVVTYARDGLRGECLAEMRETALAALPWHLRPKGKEIPRRPGGQKEEHAQSEGKDEVPRCVKRSHTRCVLALAIEGTGGALVRAFAKRYRAREFFSRAASLFHPSKARREWEAGRELLRRGVPTAEPLLWAEKRRCGVRTESYLVTRALAGAVPFRRLWNSLATPSSRRDWLEILARFLRENHEKGFAHDDLRADHVLVVPACPPRSAAPQFYFIDLDNSRIAPSVSRYRRVHNFFQFLRSLGSKPPTSEEIDVFLRAYSGGEWSDREIRLVKRKMRWIALLKRKWLRVARAARP
jgi:hypothetical protein